MNTATLNTVTTVPVSPARTLSSALTRACLAARIAADNKGRDVLGLDATVVSTHWKCTVYYAETVESSYPFPYRLTKNRAQVVYIDKTGMK